MNELKLLQQEKNKVLHFIIIILINNGRRTEDARTFTAKRESSPLNPYDEEDRQRCWIWAAQGRVRRADAGVAAVAVTVAF
ncbi:hypothetical protein L484_000316 [Morus notabilis]|uniref:Uncharacterized protein n=1 Tax=Morus notabilis TaxID=981085 RepID=W9SES5_9ROSA|nr:hypothetical protein L484_002307 [Morus notabilis]EXC53036.1 hypothetical protein L484_000316 [Morus notabilis]